MTGKKKKDGGGLQIGGNVSVSGGDFVAGNKSIKVGERGSYIGGDVKSSTIVTGDGNQVEKFDSARKALFEAIHKKIDQRTDLTATDREDLKASVQEIKTEAEKGEKADETFISRRIRNIGHMAPDIAQVVLATLANPAAGFAMIVKKVAERAQQQPAAG